MDTRRVVAGRSRKQMHETVSASFSLVINAGGESRRMGRDKALLPTPPDGRPLICHMVERLRHLPVDRLIVVSNSHAVRNALFTLSPSFPVVHFLGDAYPRMGALGGLATGLRLCPGWAAVVACDMPLLDPHLLHWLWTQADAHDASTWDAIVPVVDGQPQPFHSFYHARCLPAIETQLATGQRMVRRFFADVRTRFVPEAQLRTIDPLLRSFFNVNTPADWQQAQALLQPPHA